MNNKEFIATLAAKTGYTQDESQKMAKAIVDLMGKSFESGEPVPVVGFGTFEVKKRLERVMVNPSTGLRMLVPHFKPAATIKGHVRKGGTENG